MKNGSTNILNLSLEELVMTYSSLINQRDLIGTKLFESLDKDTEENIKKLEKQIVTIKFLLNKVEELLEKNNIDKNEILNNNYFVL